MKHGNFCVNVATSPSGSSYYVLVVAPDGSTSSSTVGALAVAWHFAEDVIARFLAQEVQREQA